MLQILRAKNVRVVTCELCMAPKLQEAPAYSALHWHTPLMQSPLLEHSLSPSLKVSSRGHGTVVCVCVRGCLYSAGNIMHITATATIIYH
jgi:hypothetical protein